MSESAADLAATVRPALSDRVKIAALDALVARCEQAERERDEARQGMRNYMESNAALMRSATGNRDLRVAAEARVRELEAALRKIADDPVCWGTVPVHIARAALADAPADTGAGDDLLPAEAFSDESDRALVWETLRSHPDVRASELALHAADRIFDRIDADTEGGDRG